MSTPPYRLTPDLSWDQAVPLINNNFDNVVQDITDLGANYTTQVRLALTVLATSVVAQTITIVSSEKKPSTDPYPIYTAKPLSGISAFVPRVDIYVDNDLDPAYFWPFGLNSGSSLSSGQKNFYPTMIPHGASFTGDLAAFTFEINNRDSAQHIYYCYFDAPYFPKANTGVFR